EVGRPDGFREHAVPGFDDGLEGDDRAEEEEREGGQQHGDDGDDDDKARAPDRLGEEGIVAVVVRFHIECGGVPDPAATQAARLTGRRFMHLSYVRQLGARIRARTRHNPPVVTTGKVRARPPASMVAGIPYLRTESA